jgi:hypothetical protein
MIRKESSETLEKSQSFEQETNEIIKTLRSNIQLKDKAISKLTK